MRGVIAPPSKLIVKKRIPPRVYFSLGGIKYEGGRSKQKSSFMRGVIVPPSKLILKHFSPPKGGVLLGGVIKGGRLLTTLTVKHASDHSSKHAGASRLMHCECM